MNLAVRMRPTKLDEFVGQKHLVGKGKILQRMIEERELFSMIYWGPPGIGKTTLAYIVANELDANISILSGVNSGKNDLQKILSEIKNRTTLTSKEILFIDEIHRWNKVQQDALLPYVENGNVILIGATTENPSFEINSALLSRCRVLVLQHLTTEDLNTLIDIALSDVPRGLGKYNKKLDEKARELLIQFSGGDARIMLNSLEIAATSYKEKIISTRTIIDIFQHHSSAIYDKKADEHYNTVSAFIKSMRASNIDASLYYLARMVESGEDPLFIARRMVIFASEDIGMAQPTALVVANEVFRACELIGYPECAINLAHGTVYLAHAKKDRSAYDAYLQAVEDIRNFPNESIPLNLRNAPTKLMKKLGYGEGYQMYSKESLLPEKLKQRKYYKGKTPT